MRLWKKLVSRVSQWYKSMSIQVIISLSFTLVAVLGTVCMSISLFWRFAADTQRMEQESSQRILSQVNLNLDSYLRRMMRISDTMYYRVIKNTDLSQDIPDAQTQLLYEGNRDSLVSIALFDSDGKLVSSAPRAALKESVNAKQAPWFTAAQQRLENLHFFTPQVQNLFAHSDFSHRWVVSLSRSVELSYGGEIENGVLLVDMNFSGIEQICHNVELSNGGYLYLIDGNGELIYHPRQQLIYAGILRENNLQAADYRDGSYRERFGDEQRQVTVKTVGYTGWRLVGVVPVESILLDTYRFVLFAVSLLLFFALLMTFLNFRISAYISEPIRKLDRAVKQLEAGGENADIPEDGCYEVQRLAHSIRSMVSTMRHLMLDIIQQEGDKRRTELEVLQSQINPHFLYNSLDSVIWMTESGRYEEAIQMVTSLAKLFRISLSKGSRIIPVTDEVQHASHYMIIQKIRYKNKFDTQIIVEESAQKLYMLKLCIQPILENAIYHGMASADGDGLIAVHLYREGDDLLIDVTDNGLGMPPEQVARLLDKNVPAGNSTSGSGIGLRNVHRRINLTFGGAYGLTFLSEPDEGTTVRIRLPTLDETAANRWKEESQ